MAWEESGGGGGGGVSPTLDQIDGESNGEKRKKKGEEKEKRRRKRKKGEERKRKIFSVFRRSKLDSLRIKVGPRNESYVWVPKSMEFVEL